MSFLKKLLFALLVLSLFSCNKVDVVVIGGGASGISAGIQASRMGVETLILEETPWVGGMLTSAGVSCIDGNYKLRSGIFGEFIDSLAQHYGGYDKLKTGWVSNVNFNPSIGQRILSNMAIESGDKLKVEREIKLISVEERGELWKVKYRDSKGKKHKVTTKILIDGTELGDIAALCGVEYRIGMEASSETGENIAPKEANDIIQDLTYVAILKDYGPDADMTIEKPASYNPQHFANSCINPLSDPSTAHQVLWSADYMIRYGAISGGYYMINWPIEGNDYYTNTIELSPEERKVEYDKAKEVTKCFIYFIQDHLGMKNLGIADDVFPTEDNLPLFPYHRESRRIVGEAFFTVDVAFKPYDYKHPYYRTGIAVGDYPVDHHHYRHPNWQTLPYLAFYPIPSFNVPLGVLLPKEKDNLIVAEKSISVSNLMNGATRLQPVTMQLGQASGALAAIAIKERLSVKNVKVRTVQKALLDAGCYLMPYLDIPKEHPNFKALQKIGSTGILRGIGKNVGWSNETWFRAYELLQGEEVFAEDYFPSLKFEAGTIRIEDFLKNVSSIEGKKVGRNEKKWWREIGLSDYDKARPITRLEAAVVLDAALDPFFRFDVNFNGNLVP